MSQPTVQQKLQTLRDEIRVKVHLAGMDAKDRWHKLEPEIDHALAELEQATLKGVERLVDKLQKFNESLVV